MNVHQWKSRVRTKNYRSLITNTYLLIDAELDRIKGEIS